MEDPQPVQSPPQTHVPDPTNTAETPSSMPPPPPPPQTQVPNPTNTAETPSSMPPPPPPQPPPPPSSLPPPSKKRPLDGENARLPNSKYLKMRDIVNDLRPHFIEVLKTPDFRNCEAAKEIQDKVKILLDLYNGLPAKTMSLEKPRKVPESQPLLGDSGTKQKPQEQPQFVKPAEPSENKTSQSGEKQHPEDRETFVGGSAFGWNFITFSGSAPVYYGVTKESFRSAQTNLAEQ